MENKRPLKGIRVVELGQLVAGPFAGTILAYFGAEVVKVEPPGSGDPLRKWRSLDETGTSYWWYSIARNKKSVTANLKTEEGREVIRRLIDSSDVLIENFRPGTMEEWKLGPEDFKKSNPSLIYTRISGYGQTGPLAPRPGYASVAEAFSGFRYVNGFPGEAPVRPNLSMGDTIAGIHAALGIVLALFNRLNTNENAGQLVDVAIYESMFNLMEGVVSEFDGASLIREASGTTITGIVPTNTYRCKDGKFVVIGGNGDSIFKRLMEAAGYPNLANDPRLAQNPGRVIFQEEIDTALSHWTSQHVLDEILNKLALANVPSGPIYNIEDMIIDPHYLARNMFESVDVGNHSLKVPAILPKLSETPGKTQWAGASLGQHTDEVLGSLGYDQDAILKMKKSGVI